MGMQPGSDGALRPQPGFLTAKIPNCEELLRPGMPECIVVEEYSPLLDSSDMGPSDWVKIANTIESGYEEFSGFVVIHGTDTMAYTASALSFMFSNLAKPVVFVGSMLPFGEVHSDARRNLACAILVASTGLSEVAIFFNDRLLRANRATKVDSAGLGAFDSPNVTPMAMMGTELVFAQHADMEPVRPFPAASFHVDTQLETGIVVIRLVPGFVDLEPFAGGTNVKGIVLQLYGTGNAPGRKTSFVNWVKKLVEKGVILVACSQCLRGRVELGEYAVGKQLEEAGVVSAMDMTTEAAVTKLAHLLPKNLSPIDLKIAFQTSLRGELTETPSNFIRRRNSPEREERR